MARRLDLRGHLLGKELGDIAALTALSELDISAAGCDVASHPSIACDFNLGLAQLARLSRLQRLNLACTAVNEEGLRGMCSGLRVTNHNSS